jgi:quercetin dioxygenase-like cupin family protein
MKTQPSLADIPRTRRVVTGHNEQGKSVIVEDGPAPNMHRSEYSPNTAQVIWATDEMPARCHNEPDPAPQSRRFKASPSPFGTILRIANFPPDSEYDAEKMKLFLREIGGHSNGSDRHFFFHKTPTLDYAIVLSGEIWALMDEGETLLKAGDVLIQRATNHSWSNRSSALCQMAFVLIDAQPE